MHRPLLAALLTGALAVTVTVLGVGTTTLFGYGGEGLALPVTLPSQSEQAAWKFSGQQLANQEPAAIDCPRGQTVWISGTGQPGIAVMLLVDERIVGGSSADSTGYWRIPLIMNEPSGSYPVRVVERETWELQAELVCLVGSQSGTGAPSTATVPRGSMAPTDIVTPHPQGLTPTSTAPIIASQPTGSAAPQASATPRPQLPTTTSTTKPASTATPSSSPIPGTTVLTTATARPSATSSPRPTLDPQDLITPSATAVAGVADRLRIFEVMAGDPESLETDDPMYGYIEIRSKGGDPIDLKGWQLVNQSRPDRPVFTFPDLLLPSNGSVTVMPDTGASTSEILYWGVKQIVWETGDRLVLRTPQGLDALTVTVP